MEPPTLDEVELGISVAPGVNNNAASVVDDVAKPSPDKKTVAFTLLNSPLNGNGGNDSMDIEICVDKPDAADAVDFSSSSPHLADTFKENSLVQDANGAAGSLSPPRPTRSNRKSRMGWIVAATLACLFIITGFSLLSVANKAARTRSNTHEVSEEATPTSSANGAIPNSADADEDVDNPVAGSNELDGESVNPTVSEAIIDARLPLLDFTNDPVRI